MKDNALNLEILENYNFKKDKPILSSNTYSVFNGTQN